MFFKKVFFIFALLPNLIFAAGGIDRVNTFLENVAIALYAIGVVTISIAIMIAGYKIAYGTPWHQTIPIIVGGIFVGCASAISGYLLG